MESPSEPLAIESFSNSWLTGNHSSLENLGDPSTASFQRSSGDSQNFKFDVPFTKSSSAIVHADQLFSDGLIRPNSLHRSSSSSVNLRPSSSTRPSPSSFSDSTVVPVADTQCEVLRRWKKRSERILQKWIGHLTPFCLGVGGTRKSIKVDDIDRREWEVKSWSNSPTYHSADSWSELEFETSIYEAILHCKKSIGRLK
ncbi:hypothetical protein K2173_013331 [Erythroxylum novogranatense]|uniref:Membrane-associated kinase regulator 6 n=1 Tax=Erythroxylum novogranatense TaxID=1862640 RepID=A0AAV8SA32_9ROSI|nr:hypothetical protein K2173_013331 [Erythroxylum novogranatense]